MNDAIRLPFRLPPVTATKRLVLFPGRHLGEQELDIWQTYQDDRLADLFSGTRPGVVRGLGVRVLESRKGYVDSVTLLPGLGVVSDGAPMLLSTPLRYPASALLQERSDDGLYLLLAERQPVVADNSLMDDGGCVTPTDSPVRDLRREVRVRLLLAPLAAGRGVSLSDRLRVSNQVAVELLGHPIPVAGLRALAVALVSVSDGRILWVESTPIRRMTSDPTGHQALFSQAHSALAELSRAAASGIGVFADSRTKVDIGMAASFVALPAAGRLPMELLLPDFLQTILMLDRAASDGSTPVTWSLFGVPSIAVQALPIRFSEAEAAVRTEIDRGPLYLDAGLPDRVNLLWAVADSDFRLDLFVHPEVDKALLTDVYNQYATAHDAWADWRASYDAVYGATAGDLVSTDVPGTKVAASEFSTFGCVAPRDQVEKPEARMASMVERALEEQGLKADQRDELPAPYDSGAPEPFRSVEEWLKSTRKTLHPEPKSWPQASAGLVLQRTLLVREIEALRTRIRDDSKTLNRMRDHALAQRQQLDAQTLNMAALAGGVALDGSGLRLTRWLPYVDYVADTTPAESPTKALAKAAASSKTSFSEIERGQSSSTAFEVTRASKDTVLAGKSVTEKTVAVASQVDSIAVDKTPLTSAAYEVEKEEFATLKNVRPEVYAHSEVFEDLRSLHMEVGRDADLAARLSGKVAAPAEDLKPATENTKSKYQKLVGLGKYLIDQISVVEQERIVLENELRAMQKKLEKKTEALGTLEDTLATTVATLRTAAVRKAAAQTDYAMALSLMEEDWATVAKSDQNRWRILSNPLAIYWVRARTAPAERTLSYSLPLRTQSPGDIVPGCHDDQPSLPDYFDPFVDALWEVPFASFRRLVPLVRLLPAREKVEQLVGRRNAEVAEVTERFIFAGQAQVSQTGQTKLQQVLAANKVAFSELASRKVATTGLSTEAIQKQASEMVGIAGILANPRSSLRDAATTLRAQMEQALSCLVTVVEGAPAEVRLDWGEDERLPLASPERWPGLVRVEKQSLNQARLLCDLVHWWFGQLVDQPSTLARTAMENAVRAVLIGAAHGDPAKLIHGPVVTTPNRFRVGETFRVKLNREPAFGAELQLFDDNQKAVGVVKVDVVDADGVKVHLTKTFTTTATITTQFSVGAKR